MKSCGLYSYLPPNPAFLKTVKTTYSRQNFPSFSTPPLLRYSYPSPKFAVNCTNRTGENRPPPPPPLSSSSAYAVLGVKPSCSASELKTAFRAKVRLVNFIFNWIETYLIYFNYLFIYFVVGKVKQYHPDVNRDNQNSDLMIRRVIQAYEVQFFQASSSFYLMWST